MRTPKLVVWVQLPLGWNTYLLFNTDIANFAWKTGEGEAVLWRCLNLRWMRGGGVGQKVLFRASWNRIFFQSWFKHDTCFSDGIFLCFIFMNHGCFRFFFFMEIYNNLDFPLFFITFTVNSHVDIHFYKYISFFQILWRLKSGFSLKYTLKETRNSYFCVTPKNHWLMFVFWKKHCHKKVVVCFL